MCSSALRHDHHDHRPAIMTTTSVDNGHADKDDQDNDSTRTSTSPSENLKTQTPKNAHAFQMVAEPSCSCRPSPTTGKSDDQHHPSSSTSSRLASTSHPSTSWGTSEQHPQKCHPRVDPYHLLDDIWRSSLTFLPSISASTSSISSSRGQLSGHDGQHHLHQGAMLLDLFSSFGSSPSSSRPASSGSPRLTTLVCAVASPTTATSPTTEEARRQSGVQHSGSFSSISKSTTASTTSTNHCVHCFDIISITFFAITYFTTFPTTPSTSLTSRLNFACAQEQHQSRWRTLHDQHRRQTIFGRVLRHQRARHQELPHHLLPIGFPSFSYISWAESSEKMLKTSSLSSKPPHIKGFNTRRWHLRGSVDISGQHQAETLGKST